MIKSNAVCPVNPLRIVSLACANSSIFPLVRCHLCLEHLIECSGCLTNVVHLVTDHRWFRARRLGHSLPRINSSERYTPFSCQIRNLFFLSVHPPAHGSWRRPCEHSGIPCWQESWNWCQRKFWGKCLNLVLLYFTLFVHFLASRSYNTKVLQSDWSVTSSLNLLNHQKS